jgi:LacI family transcriptional regulator
VGKKTPGSAPGPRRATSTDVALRAGVSQTTVSHVLSGRRPVAEATQQAVRRAIAELGFRPNEMARALRSQRSQLVATVIANILHTSYQAITHAVMDVMNPGGYLTAIYDVSEDPALQTETIRSMTDRGIDGVIFFGVEVSPEDATILGEAVTPFVQVKQSPLAALEWDTVASDASGGVAAATRHIARSGPGPVAFLGGPPADVWTPGRLEGFRRAMAEMGRGVDERLVSYSPYSREGGAASVARVMASGIVPRGIVCANDLIAIGALAALRDAGLRTPEDVAVSGYDNIDACDMVVPALTSVEPHQAESGKVAAELLLDRLGPGRSLPARRVTLPADLVVRASTGPGLGSAGEPAPG